MSFIVFYNKLYFTLVQLELTDMSHWGWWHSRFLYYNLSKYSLWCSYTESIRTNIMTDKWVFSSFLAHKIGLWKHIKHQQFHFVARTNICLSILFSPNLKAESLKNLSISDFDISVSFHLDRFLNLDDSVSECQLHSWLQDALKHARSGPEDFHQLSDVKLTLNTSARASADICSIHHSVTLHL